jgi:hypothetical protein
VSSPRRTTLLIGGAALGTLVLFVILGVVLVRALRTDEPAGAPPSVQNESAKLGREGMAAPGTKELRALGCEPATVLDMQKTMSATGAKLQEGEPRAIVTCQLGAPLQAPTCEQVASTYLTAIGTAPGTFATRVMEVSGKRRCSRLFAANGADLGTY